MIDDEGVHVHVGRFWFNFFWVEWALGWDNWPDGGTDYWFGPFNIGWRKQ